MLMPATLPATLNEYADITTDQQLLDILKNDVNRLLQFFTFACDDETWCSDHPDFIIGILSWLSGEVLANRISFLALTPSAAAIKRHYTNLHSHLPINLYIKAIDAALPVNSLLFQASSPLFYHMIHKSCFEKRSRTIILPRIFLKDLKIIEEYVYTGEVVDLWRQVEQDLRRILDIVTWLGLDGLAKSCQKILARYITPQNVYATLKLAHIRSWELLRKKCGDMINSLDAGIKISFPGPSSLECYLERISEHSMDSFRLVMPLITHLICGPTVTEDHSFGTLMEECPRLMSLDIGHTNAYSFQLAAIPSRVSELVLINCSWLNDAYFKMLIADHPSLQSLDLTSCVNLTAIGWGELLKLTNLNRLNLTRCSQITDRDLSIILDAAPGVMELDLEDCALLTESGFQHFSRGKRQLEILNLTRAGVSDASLVMLAEQQTSLRRLSLASCPHVTEQGIAETLRLAARLEELNISQCHVSAIAVDEFRLRFPNVKIIY